MKTYFITGIGTDVGKTVCAAILVEALQADYWKPLQAGDLDHTDTAKVKALVSNKKSVFHPEQIRLKAAMSPHAAAKREGIAISLDHKGTPVNANTLVIEGAGGLMVPINDKGELVIDFIADLDPEVILVSRNYLGSINHTLLSIEALRSRNLCIRGIIFNGDSNPESEEIILKISGVKCLGRIPVAEKVDADFIKAQAAQFKSVF
jgi:dethiobiotin synthetase